MSFHRAAAPAISVLALCAAVFGAFIGWVVYALAEPADGTVGTANTVQFVLGWIGIVPALAMVYFVVTQRNHRAEVALIIGLLTWGAWAVFNDAAVHGWRDSFILNLF